MSKFTNEEVKQLTNISNIMVGKVLKEYLMAILSETSNIPEHLRNVITEMEAPEYTGNVTLDIPTVTDQKIRMQLAVVSPDHGIQLQLPIKPKDEYFHMIFNQLDRFVNMVMIYYKQKVGDTSLLNQLQQVFPNIDMSRFKVNNKTRALCFDEHSKFRIGIQCDVINVEEDYNARG